VRSSPSSIEGATESTPLVAAPARASRRAVTTWLGAVCVLVVAMVVLGGVTRLTGSGLSIVEWRPVVGTIPPLSDADWREAFRAYQETPQYRLLNAGMSLGDFQRIFFWEYVHRLVGRLLGVVFAGPLVYFAFTRSLSRALVRRLALIFGLGGLQGALGWFMVKSGLVDMPSVSHYRLAAHLSLALVVLSALFWTWLDQREAGAGPVARPLRLALVGVTALLALQIVYGAFTAGLHAGVGYNTFPLMHGRLVPPDATVLDPAWRNAFENRAMVQLLHRTFGALLVVAVSATAWIARRAPEAVRSAVRLVVVGVLAQFGLGVATLLLVVPVSVATVHQLGACLLLLAVLRALYVARPAAA
jgi:cytochrome c oxidase assembly protein subunit 15